MAFVSSIDLCNPLIQFGEVFIDEYRSGFYHDSHLISYLKTKVTDPLGDDEGGESAFVHVHSYSAYKPVIGDLLNPALDFISSLHEDHTFPN